MKETNVINIPSCPKDRKEIHDVIKAISDSKVRAQAEADYQKEAIKELSERFEVDKKWLSKMATEYYKNTFDKTVVELEDYTALYETIMKVTSKVTDQD